MHWLEATLETLRNALFFRRDKKLLESRHINSVRSSAGSQRTGRARSYSYGNTNPTASMSDLDLSPNRGHISFAHLLSAECTQASRTSPNYCFSAPLFLGHLDERQDTHIVDFHDAGECSGTYTSRNTLYLTRELMRFRVCANLGPARVPTPECFFDHVLAYTSRRHFFRAGA